MSCAAKVKETTNAISKNEIVFMIVLDEDDADLLFIQKSKFNEVIVLLLSNCFYLADRSSVR